MVRYLTIDKTNTAHKGSRWLSKAFARVPFGFALPSGCHRHERVLAVLETLFLQSNQWFSLFMVHCLIYANFITVSNCYANLLIYSGIAFATRDARFSLG